jgi:hypothetical protein
VHRGVLDEFPCRGHELGGGRGHARFLQRGDNGLAGSQQRDKRVHWTGPGSGLPHAVKIQFEVAGEARAELIAFLDKDDVVDQPSAGGRPGRQPGDLHASQASLEGLQQGHEIPDSEYVMLHECHDRGYAVKPAVKRMAYHCAAGRVNRFLEPFNGLIRLTPLIPWHDGILPRLTCHIFGRGYSVN